ncbi:hypothetical protein A0H81_14704 [Grifola frondosa]|uniref:Transmembrane protein n=1 Tax=Grifola frondosa TaxID=5627 RepID=A0A1C7LMT4_GRIFR|nr:hypothetical protein A0H81_14704 [Grifola frondosa]
MFLTTQPIDMLLLLRSQVVLAFVVIVNAGVILVDDSDPRITYVGDWMSTSLPRNQDVYNSTMTFTVEAGASASFSFTGTAISIYSVYQPTNATAYTVNATYIIDGLFVSSYFTPTPTSAEILVDMLVFTSSPLPDAQHTLLITNYGDLYLLDYLEVAIPDSTSNPSNYWSSTLNPPASSSDRSSATNQVSNTNPGVIAGVAVGVAGAMLLMLLLVCCWWFRRRRVCINESSSSRERILQGNQMLPNIIQPYTMAPNTSQQHITCADTPIPQRQSTLSAIFPTHVQATQMETPSPPPSAYTHNKLTAVSELNMPSVQSTESDEIMQNQVLALSSPPSPWPDILRGARQPRDSRVHIAGGSGVPGTYIFDSEGFSEEESTLPPSYKT